MNTLRIFYSSFGVAANVLLMVNCATAQASKVATVATEARARISASEPKRAIALIEAAKKEDKNLDDNSDLAFAQGVAWQQVAASSSDAQEKRVATQRAVQAYEQAARSSKPVLSVDAPRSLPGTTAASASTPSAPTPAAPSSAISNNLAELYAQAGDDSKARAAYEQAIANDDPRRGYYALNYARYLESRDPPRAIIFARQALDAQPESNPARELLASLLWRNDLNAMLPFIAQQSGLGYTDLSTRIAIKCLTAGNRPAEEKRAWLVLLARIATASYAYSATTRDALLSDLQRLSVDPDVGKGSQQLRAALLEPPSSSEGVGWWKQQSAQVAALNTNGRTAMRNLLRAAADTRLQKEPAAAEAYLLVALDLGENYGPDADIFLRLAELYANTNNRDQLKALMDRHQYELFTEKSAAYARGDWPLIYRMHVALGMTYAHLGIWQSAAEYQNAIFQLESAQKAAQRLNQMAQQQNKTERVALPPVAIAKLAEGYSIIGRKDLSLTTHVNGASNLQKLGRLNDSDDVLESIATEQVHSATPAIQNRIETLKATVRQAK